MKLSDFTYKLMEYLPRLLGALPLAIAIMVGTFVLNLLLGRALLLVARRTHLSALDVLPVKQIVQWLTRLIAAILILSVFGFEIGGIWAMLSTILGLVAIGFVAVWSLISHTTATVLILFLRPFQMGDDLEFPGEPVNGRAVDINFFFTTLVDHEGAFHQVPNNLFFQKVLRRRKNQHVVSLAAQLNSRLPVSVDLPPAPPRVNPGRGTAAEPDPLMTAPDPHSILPGQRTKNQSR